jgi:hypothetical protein
VNFFEGNMAIEIEIGKRVKRVSPDNLQKRVEVEVASSNR